MNLRAQSEGAAAGAATLTEMERAARPAAPTSADGVAASSSARRMALALRRHWPEYLMEAAELGLFMLAACLFTVVLEHPSSFIRQAIETSVLRRLLMGAVMGLTAISLIYSPLGKQSGAHFNPAVTLTFFSLGRVEVWDAVFYIAAQFLGGALGVVLAVLGLGMLVADPAVNYAATLPAGGTVVAFAAEFGISFLLMTVILASSNGQRFARFTGVFAGLLVASYITLEAPISGMSMNPARTLASALPGRLWDGLWIYFTAPPLGMLAAAAIFRRRRGLQGVLCAKLHHHNDKRCIFRCGYAVQPTDIRASAQDTTLS